ncbi:MAG: hypothetical protein IPL80_19950 [Sterolibacteriaceae bacterium]|nr:hypothetical protein [Sterolibacteriaceae bacterium]
MEPHSAFFADAILRGGYVVTTVVRVWHGTTLATELPCIGGEVMVDESSNVRRVLTLETDADLQPYELTDLLAPPNCEIEVRTGVDVAGRVETVPVFWGSPTRPEAPSLLSPTMRIVADDRSRKVARSRLLRPWNTPAGSLVTAEITRLLHDVDPSWQVFDLTGSRLVTSAATWTEDRLEPIDSLAGSMGAEVFSDPLGRFVIRPIPDGSGSPVWALDIDHDKASLVDAAVSMDAERAYNLVRASSSAPDVEVSAEAFFVEGPLAWPSWQNPRFFASPFLRTVDQCVSAALAELPRSLVSARDVTCLGAVNPALASGDPVACTLPGRDPETRILSAFPVPLSEDTATSAYRTRPIAASVRASWAMGVGTS